MQVVCEVCNSDRYYPHKCTGCKRPLCTKCQSEWYEYNEATYCDTCWTIGEPYREEIEEYKQKIMDIEYSWHIACSL
jgi:hypothetical protein